MNNVVEIYKKVVSLSLVALVLQLIDVEYRDLNENGESFDPHCLMLLILKGHQNIDDTMSIWEVIQTDCIL